MRRLAALLVAAAALCAAALAADARPRGQGGASGFGPYASPSAVIGAEIAFNQLAQQKGQWTAFRETAARDAVMFVPERVNAREWLKGRPNPPVAVKWQAYQVWMSCDGSFAVTRGAWQRPNGTGFFTTVWQRQPKDGGYKWLLDLGGAVASPLPAPEMIVGKVAECRARKATGADRDEQHDREDKKLAPIDPVAAQSADGTLRWKAALDARGAGTFTVERWTGSGYEDVLHAAIPPQG